MENETADATASHRPIDGAAGAGTAGDRPLRADEALAPSTLELWRRCADSPREADWYELHQRLHGRLRLWLQRGLVGPFRHVATLEADDLAQEVFCRLLAHEGRALRACRAECDGELMAYLSRVCNSVLVSAARELGAYKRRSACVVASSEVEAQEVPARGLDPEERAMVSDVRRKATACTTAVCPVAARRQRFILDQVLFVGYTSGELARSIGISASAIDTAVSRARRRGDSLGIPLPRRACTRSAGFRRAQAGESRRTPGDLCAPATGRDVAARSR